jgi:hypothetical protein
MDQGGPVAHLALLLVVPATIIAFAKLSPTRAILAVFFGTILFLPEMVQFDAPGLPALGKHTIPGLCLLIGAFIAAKDRVRRARVGRGLDLLLIAALAGVVGTVFTNGDALHYGIVTLPGLGPSDIVSGATELILGPGAAFVLGRIACRSARDAQDLLLAFVIGGLVYLPFILVELKMSPQWHNWIYGFGQHSFLQVRRGSGYRPMCFMAHGLALALFISASAFCGWQLMKSRSRTFGFSPWVPAVTLTILLVLVNSLGALLYGIFAVLVSWFMKPKAQIRVAMVLALLVALYPWLRISEIFPADSLVDLSARFSQDRAGSLGFRFKNEDDLLEKALLRPLFGWGGWGRGFTFNEELGRTFTVIDGTWVLYISIWGFVGFALRFGMLILPIFVAARSLSRIPSANQPLLAGAALATILYTVDLLPNGMFNQLPMFLAGAVVGLSQGMTEEKDVNKLDQAVIHRFLAVLRRAAMQGMPGGARERRASTFLSSRESSG